MKRIVDAPTRGFTALLGEKIMLMCGTYFYTGVLMGINDNYLELTDPKIVYETGPLNSGPWADAQDLPTPWYVMIHSIESWGSAKC